MTTAFSRLMSCTAAAGVSPAPPPPVSIGISSMPPDTRATAINIQFASTKSTINILLECVSERRQRAPDQAGILK